MTITHIHSEADITDDDCASALIWFAEQALLRWSDLDPVLPAVVATLTHRTHVDSGVHMALFEQVKEAVAQRAKYVADPRDYTTGYHNETAATDAAMDRLDEATTRDIDMAAFDMVHPGPSCVTCRQVRPRQGWRGAYNGSLFCVDHQHARSA